MSEKPRRATSISTTEHKTGSVEELTAHNVSAIVDLEEGIRRDRSLGERFAHAVAKFSGSMTFLWINAIWFGGWIVVNSVGSLHHFDPFPFTFLTLVVSLEAIFLSIFILISQNHETKLSERRNHLDLQINLLAEQENTKMLNMLEAIGKAVGAEVPDDPEAKVLEQATRPEKLAQQIEKAMDDEARSHEGHKDPSKR